MKVVNKTTSRDGTSIAFERTGSGPALILVDAAGCFRGFGPMGPLAAVLAADFTVFTYDRRGRGDSTDTLPYAVEREVEDLHALIDAAGGSAFVHGFSSGSALALHAAEQGLAIPRLALLEPPVPVDDQPAPESDLGAEVAELVAAGRRGDAIEHFQTSIGVPAEMIAGMRQDPSWPALEALAHTLVYDTVITGSLSVARLSAVTTPTLVIDSEGSDGRLRTWAQGVADTLANARQRSLKGEWHGVPAEDLAAVLVEFFTDR
ncbi:alpha/beta fold hydrolase [Micromonospora sp. NPDC000668]|uniref:alpha/beta fold hydrolase n=1 Tax=Micromonospora sp. NPDC000668 TaxID=3364219 RepID=UPI003692DCEF